MLEVGINVAPSRHVLSILAVGTSGVVMVSVSATHKAALFDFSKSHVESTNQEA